MGKSCSAKLMLAHLHKTNSRSRATSAFTSARAWNQEIYAPPGSSVLHTRATIVRRYGLISHTEQEIGPQNWRFLERSGKRPRDFTLLAAYWASSVARQKATTSFREMLETPWPDKGPAEGRRIVPRLPSAGFFRAAFAGVFTEPLARPPARSGWCRGRSPSRGLLSETPRR